MTTDGIETEGDGAELATLGALVPGAYRLADRIGAEAEVREEKNGLAISCSAGCSACCNYLVRISIPEAVYINERLDAMAEDRRASLEARFSEAESSLAADGLDVDLGEGLVRERGDVAFDHRLNELSRRYLALGLACPFLTEDSCSFYAERPIVCRRYGVTSPAELCRDPFGLNVRRVGMDADVLGMLSDLAAELLTEPPRTIPLALAPAWAARNPDSIARQWPRRELLAKLYEKAGMK